MKPQPFNINPDIHIPTQEKTLSNENNTDDSTETSEPKKQTVSEITIPPTPLKPTKKPQVQLSGETMSLFKATETIQKIFQNPKGSESDIRHHDEMVTRCIAGDMDARKHILSKIEQALKTNRIIVPEMDPSEVAWDIYKYIYGLGVIQELWDDPLVDEIKVNRYDNIWYIKNGVNIKAEGLKFRDDERVNTILTRMILHSGKSITKDEPRIRVMRRDKSRLTATIPPFSRYVSFALRKMDNFELTEENYLQSGTVSPWLMDFIKCLLRGRATIIISGPTNSGKSTDLMFYLQFLPPNCRIVVLDKTGELFLQDRYKDRDIVELQEVERIGLSLKDGFDTILSYTPNIIVVPEVRSTEGEEMLKACTRGHDGSLTTVHANSPEEVIENFPNIIMEDGKLRNEHILRTMVARAFNVIIQKTWNPETGKRRIDRITEIMVENNQIKAVDLVAWNNESNKWDFRNWPSKRIYDRMKFYQVPLDMMRKAGLRQ